MNAGLNARDAEEMGLCLNEALANIIRHAYRGADDQMILVTAETVNGERTNDSGCAAASVAGSVAASVPVAEMSAVPPYHGPAVRVTIRDWGTGVNPAALPPKPRDPLQPGGVGLICLRSLLDEVTYTPQPDGMLLSMTRRKK